MPQQDPAPENERRRLTAAWLNIVAAGLVSAGGLPFLNALALEGWSARAREFGSLAAVSLALGTVIHLAGRWLLRTKGRGVNDPRLVLPRSEVKKADTGPDQPAVQDTFPTERDVDEVLAEFDGDARAAVRALLQDLDELASDREAQVPEGVRDRWTRKSA
jgi:hypothetical protein